MKPISLPVFAFLLVHPLHAFFIVNIDDNGEDNGLLALNSSLDFGLISCKYPEKRYDN